MKKRWYIGGFGIFMIFMGVAVVADTCNKRVESQNRSEMIRACGEMCVGEVSDFHIDWRNHPVCECE